jgi:glycosyltransferase involved in cell wall biosynthesis
MNVLISVIVPVFNVENYIVECIKSLSKQTHLDFELIIVDDGSTDQSINLIEKELKKFKRKKIIKQKNMGLAEARNVGIANCTGHYVTFVDSDDTISKDYIEIFKKSLLKNKADIIIANHIVKRNKKEIHSYDYFSDSKSEIFKKFLACRVSSSACAKLYKKSLFIKYKVSFPKGYLFEDVATTYKLYF